MNRSCAFFGTHANFAAMNIGRYHVEHFMKTYVLCIVLLLSASAGAQPTPLVDQLILGDPTIEAAHQLESEKSELLKGALAQPARRLMPGGQQPWEGGRLRFVMRVDPDQQNYLTARFWGDEPNPNALVLFCEGKQVGYRHLGDIDVLALPDDEPRYNGRFYYATTPLPRTLTVGKKEVRLEIRSYGPVWGYGMREPYKQPDLRRFAQDIKAAL